MMEVTSDDDVQTQGCRVSKVKTPAHQWKFELRIRDNTSCTTLSKTKMHSEQINRIQQSTNSNHFLHDIISPSETLELQCFKQKNGIQQSRN